MRKEKLTFDRFVLHFDDVEQADLNRFCADAEGEIHMKRPLALLLAVLLTPLPLLCHAAAIGCAQAEPCAVQTMDGQAAYTEDAITALCKDAAAKEGIPSAELDGYQVSIQPYCIDTNGIFTQKWLVSFQESDDGQGNFVFAIFALPSGSIQTSNRSREVFSIERQRLEWEEEKGLFPFWCVEDKALFNQRVNTPLGYQSSAELPDDTAIPLPAALRWAQEALGERYGLSADDLDRYLIDPSYMCYQERPCWIFFLPR